MIQTENDAFQGEEPAKRQGVSREPSFIMSTAGTHKPTSHSASSYDHLLAAAQSAQASADRAVADLATVKRIMVESPRVLQLRRDELARAQASLTAAENDYIKAREQVAARQNEAARLIEAAADAQRALAHALIAQDAPAAPDALDQLSARLAAANAQTHAITPLPSPATLGPNRYTPTPAMHPADLHYEVVEYLRERDALCPSCGHSLRGVQSARCPGCKLQLSLKVLHAVRARASAAPRIIWFVRALCGFAFAMSAYLAYVTLSGGRPIGCGGGSGCDLIMRSAWSKLMGIPVALFALPLFTAIFFATFFQRVGLTDTTRRRSWSVLTALALIAGFSALWFIGAQIVVFKSMCPHCVLVHLASLLISATLLIKAPLRGPEKLPEPATGRIMVPRRAAIIATIIALVGSITFAALHGGLSSAQGPIDRNKILGIPDKPEGTGGGLMMKGLEGIETPEPPVKNEQPAPKETTPGSDASPGRSNDSPAASAPDSATKTPITPAGSTTPEPEPQPTGLLLKGLDLTPTKSDDKK